MDHPRGDHACRSVPSSPITGAAGDVACGPQLCDDFALHVSTPAGYGSSHQLTVKVAWAQAAADFDIYLLDSTSSVVASAASSWDPEVIVVPPTTGDYTVRVVPFAPLDQLVTGTATLTTVPTNPPPSTATPPTYSQYGAPGWKLSGGEVEAADAASSFSGNSVIGRWAIRAMTGCQGNTGVSMVTAKAG